MAKRPKPPEDRVAKARQTRTNRADRLRELKRGELPILQLFTDCPEELQGATVAQVLANVPGLRNPVVRVLCLRHGVWPLDTWGAVLEAEHLADALRQSVLENT